MSVYRISELAEKAGVTKRTIHYYIGRGLLPPADGEGLASSYGEEHLTRLLFIKRQQEDFLPLEEIRKRLQTMSGDDVRKAVEDSDTGTVAVAEDSAPTAPSASITPADTAPARYERIDLGLGIELHVPMDNRRAADVAALLSEYAKKVVKEG